MLIYIVSRFYGKEFFFPSSNHFSLDRLQWLWDLVTLLLSSSFFFTCNTKFFHITFCSILFQVEDIFSELFPFYLFLFFFLNAAKGIDLPLIFMSRTSRKVWSVIISLITSLSIFRTFSLLYMYIGYVYWSFPSLISSLIKVT